jgi:diguanylate cyclase (GGDEF)-like protein/PAS domain S-box-containing protein
MWSRRLKDVPISTKVFLAPGLTLCALLLLAVVAFVGLQDGRRHISDLSDRAFVTFRLAVAANGAASEVQLRLLDAISVSATEADKKRVEPRIAAVEQAASFARNSFDALDSKLGRNTAAIIQLRGHLEAYLAAVQELLHIVPDDPASAWIILNEVRRSYLQLSHELARFEAEADALRETASQEAMSAAAIASFILLLVVILAAGSSALATVVVARSITRPIARLTKAMSDLAAGGLAVAVPELDREDEVGSMAAAMQVFKEGLIKADRLGAEREFRRARELGRLRQLVDATFEGILIHRDGIILDSNVAVGRLFGQPATAMRGRDVVEFVAPASTESICDRLRSDCNLNTELDMLRADGSTLSVEILSRPFEYDGGGVVTICAIRDLSERKLAEAQIHQLAYHDALTGLPNRYQLNDRLMHGLELCARDGGLLAVLCLDLDHFKDVNDTLGHPVGDLLLQAAAERLRASVRGVDMIARFGGDEFTVVLSDIQRPIDAALVAGEARHDICETIAIQGLAAGVADRILEAFQRPFSIGGNEIRSGTSIGIAVYGLDSPDVDTLLSHADVALYRAKAEARGTYRFFTADMDAEVRARITMDTELREAIATNQFFLMYQPQVEIDTGRIVGLEALVRWRHPTRGIVGPGKFIPAAEKGGLIVGLGRWVMREACRQTRQWLDAGIAPPLIAVNLSAVQFKMPLELETDIAEIMAESDLPPRIFELELTESILMEASRGRDDALLRLRRMGLRVAIDDFGSGYSSLDYLRRYPVDRIKIAQTFIADIGIVAGNDAIVRAALGLARELDIEVVVEGVETIAQLALLKAWGGRIVQGYYYARPLAAPEVTALLRDGTITPAQANPVEPVANRATVGDDHHLDLLGVLA